MRRYLIIPVIAGLLVTLGACGAKDEPAPTATESPAKSSSDDSTTTTKAAGDDETDATDASDATDDVPSDGGDALPNVLGTECAEVAQLYSAIMAQSLMVLGPNASSTELEELAGDLDEAKANVPDEIADAFDTWSAAWTEFAAVMEEIGSSGGVTNPANAEKLDEASEKLDTPEVKAASEELERYFQEQCTG